MVAYNANLESRMYAILIDAEVYATADTYEEGRDFARRYGLARFGTVTVCLLADVA